jgi:hypothetical protein
MGLAGFEAVQIADSEPAIQHAWRRALGETCAGVLRYLQFRCCWA